MKFTKQKAQHLQKKHHLSPSTIANWRAANRIPDCYADPDYQPTYQRGIDRKEALRLLEILQTPGMNRAGFQLPHQRFIDVARGHTTSFTKREAKSLYKELRQVRKKARRFVDSRKREDLKSLLDDPRIKKTTLVNQSLVTQLQRGDRLKKERLEKVGAEIKKFMEQIDA